MNDMPLKPGGNGLRRCPDCRQVMAQDALGVHTKVYHRQEWLVARKWVHGDWRMRFSVVYLGLFITGVLAVLIVAARIDFGI